MATTHDVHLIQTFDFQRVRVNETRGSAEKFNVVAAKLILHDTDFALGNLRNAHGKIANRNPIADDIVASIKRTVAKSCEVKNRFAQCFAGNRTAMDADTAEHIQAVDDCYALSEFCCGDSAFLSGRAAANYDEVIRLRIHRR